MKHNYCLKSTCAPLKMLSPGNSLKNPDLDMDKKLKKLTQTVLLLMTFAFYESNFQ